MAEPEQLAGPPAPENEAPPPDAAEAPAPEAAAAAEPAAAPPPRARIIAPLIPIGEQQAPKPSAEALAAELVEAWSGIPFEQKYNFGDLEVIIAPERVLEACVICREHPKLALDYLMLLSGTDYQSYYEVVYHLYSYRYRHRLTIKAKLDYERPSVPSVVSVWPGADWHERETAEMLGIDFPGHPNLVPLLLEEGVEEKPLRKSHPLVPVFFDRPGIVTGNALTPLPSREGQGEGRITE